MSTALKWGLGPEIAARLVSLERLQERRGQRKTGVGLLDELLGGGWPRGALAEVTGRRSSGRTAVVLASLAQAMAAGEATALVDVGGAFDPRAAAACGVTLPALLWIRCEPAQALKAADLVVSAGGFGLCTLDLCDARLRAPDAAWVRLAHAARSHGTTVLVAAGTRAVGTYAAAAVEMGNGAPAFLDGGPPLWSGLEVRATRLRGDRRAGGSANGNGDQPTCVSLAFTYRS